MTQDTQVAVPEAEMSLMGHLKELRSRLIRSAMAIIVSAVAVWFLFDWLFAILEAPYCEYYEQTNDGAKCKFLVTEILEPFSVQLSVAGWGGLIFALPIVLYQLARFIMPGLYPNERKVLLAFVPMSVILMFAGIFTAYFLMPKAIDVLLGFGPDTFAAQLSPRKYIQFFVKMLLAFGLAFQLPVVLIFLQKVGLLKADTLKKNRRYAAVAVVAAGAVITPTGDPFTLAVISVPMYIFYEISILVGSRMKFKQTIGPSAEEASA